MYYSEWGKILFVITFVFLNFNNIYSTRFINVCSPPLKKTTQKENIYFCSFEHKTGDKNNYISERNVFPYNKKITLFSNISGVNKIFATLVVSSANTANI